MKQRDLIIDRSVSELLAESELISRVLEQSKQSETLLSVFVEDFKKDLIEKLALELSKNHFDEVDRLVIAYQNYKTYYEKISK